MAGASAWRSKIWARISRPFGPTSTRCEKTSPVSSLRVKDTAQSRADSEVEALQERLNKLADDVQAGGREGLRAVEQQIEERPLASLAIAFAVGMVLGRLFDRR